MWGTNKKKNSNRIFKFCLGNVYYWNGMNRIRICLIRNTFVSWVSWIQMRVQGAKYQPTPAKKWFIKFQPVLRIHSINADPGSAQEKKIKFQIRIWIQILFLVVFMLKLDEQFREKEIFNHLFFLTTVQIFFLCVFGWRFASWILHIFADPTDQNLTWIRIHFFTRWIQDPDPCQKRYKF